MALTREYELAEMRRELCQPKHQRPSHDDFLSAYFAAEQWMLNKQAGSRRVWSRHTTTITTVEDQEEYTLSAEGNESIGKPYFVYRAYGTSLVPIPMTDFGNEIPNQSYDFIVMPASAASSPTTLPFGYSAEKIAFYRIGGSVRARIFPTPSEDDNEYTVFYSTGRLEPDDAGYSDVPIMPEHSRLRIVRGCLTLIQRCEWDGYARGETRTRRQDIKADLKEQYIDLHEEFVDYLDNPTHEPADEVGYWFN